MTDNNQKKTRTHKKEKSHNANELGETFYNLKKEYLQKLESLFQAKETKTDKNFANTGTDEIDRLNTFLDVCGHWLKYLCAFEYAAGILNRNLRSQRINIQNEPLPLYFRLERNQPSYTHRLIKASFRTPTSDDVTILDVINDCYRIPILNREGKLLVDDSDVIRFVRFHSKKDRLLDFKSDLLSQICSKMYDVLRKVIEGISRYFKIVIQLINQTPMPDLEYAFTGINPDECRKLLRLKFQSLLPGINEAHHGAPDPKEDDIKSVRTIETMEEYDRIFRETRNEVLGNLKTTLAMSYWLRKMLLAINRNNRRLQIKEEVNEQDSNSTVGKNRLGFDKWLLVGTSITIGDDDIANFNIDPDNIIHSQMSIQRVDRQDKWIAVRKSEKSHRLLKRDFFTVVQKFLNQDLNVALKKFGLRQIDLKNQLLPEINERLGDEERIEMIRSGILGTTITNLEEFYSAKKFHSTIKRYFQKPAYDDLNYPAQEKFNAIAKDLSSSNTAILQMKYRRVLKVQAEVAERLKNLNLAIKQRKAPEHEGELEELFQATLDLNRIVRKIQQVMVFAKPSLKDIKFELKE